MRRRLRRAAREVFPRGGPLQRPVVGRETLLSIDKARRLLGYEPQHGWRDELRRRRSPYRTPTGLAKA